MSHLARSRRMFMSNGGASALPAAGINLALGDTNAGFLPNRLTTAQRNMIPNPRESLLIYNTTTEQYEYYSANQEWLALGDGNGNSDGLGQTDIEQALDTIFGLSNLSFYFPLDESTFGAITDRSGNGTELIAAEGSLEDIQMGVVPSGVPDGKTGMHMHGAAIGVPYREDLWGLKGNNGAWFFHVTFPETYDFVEFQMYNGEGSRFRLEVWTNDNPEIRVYDSNGDQIHRSNFPNYFIKSGGRALIGLIIDYSGTWRFMINEHMVTFRPDLSTIGTQARTFVAGGYDGSEFSTPITFRIVAGRDSPIISHFFGYPGYSVDSEDIESLLGAFGLSDPYLVGRASDGVYERRVPLIGPSVGMVFDTVAQLPYHYFPLNSADYPNWDVSDNYGGIKFSTDGERPGLINGGAGDGKLIWALDYETLRQTRYFPNYFDYADDTHHILVDSYRDDGGEFYIKAEHVDINDVAHKKWELTIDFYTYSYGYITLTYFRDDGSPYAEVTSRLRPSTGSKLCLMWGYSSKYDTAFLCVNGYIDFGYGGDGEVKGTITEPNQDGSSIEIYGSGVGVSHFGSWTNNFIGEAYMRSITGALGYGRDNDYAPTHKPVVSEYFDTVTSVVWQNFSLEGKGIIESTGNDSMVVLLGAINLNDWPIGGVLELCRVGSGEMVFRLDNGMENVYSVIPVSGEGGWSSNTHGWKIPTQGASAFIRRRSEFNFIIQGASFVEVV